MCPVHLPQHSTAFVGREEELSAIATLLGDPTCRLVTLVGSGGIGKTRFAIQVASQHQVHFNDGTFFVALTAIDSPDFLSTAIGSALQISFFGSDDPLLQITNYLHNKQLLLVMDNFEHLLDGVEYLSKLLQTAPRIKILATSRERLNLHEEWVFALSGLAYPRIPIYDAPEKYSAVQLFVQRARQAQHNFLLGEHLQAVLSICHQLDGMPLGLELAASWLRVMSCEQVAERMERNLDFLTTPFRNVPERHRSLRGVFQQSWSLLTSNEQAVLARLSFFHAGFDLAAAIAVAGATLSVLAGLGDKSLLRTDATGRYHLHELLRQYASEKLAESGEISKTVQGYLNYFMALAETAEAYAYGSEQVEWYNRQEIEMDNLRAALTWSINHNEIAIGLRIAAALRWVWEMRGYLVEGLAWFQKLLPLSRDVAPQIRTKALYRATELAAQLVNEQQANLWIQEALPLARSVNDKWNLAWTLSVAGYFTEQDSNQSVAMLEESLTIFRELKDAQGLSHTLRRLAGCAIKQEKYDYAIHLSEQALHHDRTQNDKNAIAWDICFMGVALWGQYHQPAQVIPLYEESIALFEEIKDVRGKSHPLVMLAEAERTQENFDRAESLYRQTLKFERELAIHDNLALYALLGLANIAANRGKLNHAAKLLGAMNAAFQSGAFNMRLFPLMPVFDATLAVVRLALDEITFNAMWAVGNTLAFEQVVDDALMENDPTPTGNQSLIEPLTSRELDVLQLLGDGLSNTEIADKLFISVATVKVHNRNIFGKLSVSNRTNAIIAAQRLNLI